MRERRKIIEIVNIACLVACVGLYHLIFVFFENNESIFQLRHFVIITSLAVSCISMCLLYGVKFYKNPKVVGKPILWVIPLSVLFLIVSFITALVNNVSFSFRTLTQISLFLFPTIYAFNILNILPKKKLILTMEILSLILVVFYFMEPRHTVLEFFNPNNWASIDLIKSTTFTESHICAEAFLQVFLLFLYYCRFTEDGKKDGVAKWFLGINFIFTILSFKRLGVIFAVFMFIASYFVKLNKVLKSRRALLIKNIIIVVLIVGITILYTKFVQGELFTGANVNSITTNRGYILGLWAQHDYFSYGYGTSLYVMGRYLEMDLVQILIELGPVCLALFCYVYINAAGKNLFSNIVIIYAFLNMTTSSTMPWMTGWIFLVLCVLFTTTSNAEISNSMKSMKKKKKKKILIIDYCADSLGGVERVVSTVARNLSKSYSVEVLSENKFAGKSFYDYPVSIRRKYMFKFKKEKDQLTIFDKVYRKAFMGIKIRSVMREMNEYDTIIFSRVFVALHFMPYFERRKDRPKVIVRDAIHLYDLKDNELAKMRKFFPSIVDMFIVSSDESARVYEDYFGYGSVRTAKIYNPLGITPRIGCDESAKTVVSIGRMDDGQKGFDNLIKAFVLVHEKHPDWELALYGSGEEKHKLLKLISDNSAESYIKILPATKNVVEVFNKSSIFVLASRYEGYANILVEALSCGIPSVSYDWLMGVDEIIKDGKNGLVARLEDRKAYMQGSSTSKDCESLANKIIDLIDSPSLRKKFSVEGPKIVASRSSEVIMAEWRKIIEDK